MKKIVLPIAAIALVVLLWRLFYPAQEERPVCEHPETTDTKIEATCDHEGYLLHVCKTCMTEYRTDFVKPLGHTLQSSPAAPTCTEQGYTLFACNACEYEYRSDFTAPIAHTLQSKTVPASCDKEGYEEFFCACGYSYQIHQVPPTGHTLTQTPTLPTCTEQGYTSYQCTECTYAFVGDYVIPTGHDFDKKITYPTSTSNGYTEFSCGCGYDYTGDYVIAGDVYRGAYVEGTEILARGVDISTWNGEINWDELREAGIEFVILKAGSSLGKDAAFEENYARAKQEGFGVGCYFYTYFNDLDDAAADAATFMEWLEGKQFDYPVYLDLEETSLESLDRELLTSMSRLFIETLQANGYYCGLYVNNNWLKNLLNTEKVTAWFDVWYARWTLSGEATWPASFGESRMGIWQYSAQGTIGTHAYAFDMNVAYFDYPTYIKSLGYNGYQTVNE